MSDEEKTNDYDLEPVVYCSRCYSLKIKHDDTFDEDYCVDCGCTDVIESTIDVWEECYEKRYGDKFAKRTNTVKNFPIHRMSLSDLKVAVLNHPQRKNIIKTLYPNFPGDLDKTDCIILFFDKLSSDNKIEDLRNLLIKLNSKQNK